MRILKVGIMQVDLLLGTKLQHTESETIYFAKIKKGMTVLFLTSAILRSPTVAGLGGHRSLGDIGAYGRCVFS